MMSSSSGDFRTLHFYQGGPLKRQAQQGLLGLKDDTFVLGNDTSGHWNSQVGQDFTISHIFQNITEPHYFVDLAANHAVYLSNTRSLERDHDWDGLCIEGNEKLIVELLQHRRCAVFAGLVSNRRDRPVQFDDAPMPYGTIDDAFASIGKKGRRGYTVPIADILRRAGAPRIIDYLSLDVEGMEQSIFMQFPFDEYSVRAMTIERPTGLMHRELHRRNFTYAFTHGWFGDQLWLSNNFPGGVRRAIREASARLSFWVDWFCNRENASIVCSDQERYVRRMLHPCVERPIDTVACAAVKNYGLKAGEAARGNRPIESGDKSPASCGAFGVTPG